ncbi:Thiamine-phosphate synthase [compost metagenome]
MQDGADYLGIGPIFPTSSKNDAKEARGTSLLEELRTLALPIPLVGIGGITIANASSVLEAGADGISLISAIAAAPSVSEAAAAFARLVHR